MNTPNINTRISLKGVKYFAAGSEETNCFVATVYFDGKKVGSAQNDGHGGATFIHYTTPEVAAEVQAYAASLPEHTYQYGETKGSYPSSDETVVDGLVDDHIVDQQLTRLLGKCLVFTRAGDPGLYQTKGMPKLTLAALAQNPAEAQRRLNAEKVLNCLPLAEAREIFRKQAEAA